MNRTTTCIAATLLAAIPLVAMAEDQPRTITVSGLGKASAPPDMATIHTGVVTLATTASEALSANNQAVEKLFQVLKDHNVASKDIQTSQFNIQPEYKRGPRGEQLNEIIGYRVTNQVRVRLRNLPDLGRVLDALVKAGSNQISGISFRLDDATGVLNQARSRAVADARSRAELYAHAAGVRLGRVVAISEQAIVPQPEFQRRAAFAPDVGAVPIASGEQEVTSTVYMVFEIAEE